MYEIATDFILLLCIDMALNQQFWYLSKVFFVFLMISCRKARAQSVIFAEMLAQHNN